MHMPQPLRELSAISFLAQQHLLPTQWKSSSEWVPDFHPLPTGWNIIEDIAVNEPKTMWAEMYKNYGGQYVRTSDGEDGAVELVSSDELPDERKWPKDVCHFTSRDTGVFYPDSIRRQMAWRADGECCRINEIRGRLHPWINPFAELEPAVGVISHTELLVNHMNGLSRSSSDLENLQWAMAGLSLSTGKHEKSRGNWGYALLDRRPRWLSKQQFLAFFSLRGSPLLQLRKLCVALKEHTLPLVEPAVHLLLKQMLYHAGEASETQCGDTIRFWHKELLEGDTNPNGVCCTLLEEVVGLADMLKDKPRDSQAVLILGEIAAFLSEYHAPFKDAARLLSKISTVAVEALEKELTLLGPSSADATHLRAKICIRQLQAVLCYKSNPSPEDVSRLLQLMAMISCRVDQSAKTDLEAEVLRLKTLALDVMSGCSVDVVAAVKKTPAILTEALRKVVQNAPVQLDWKACVRGGVLDDTMVDTESSLCYLAECDNSDVYSIHLLTGLILFNGNPIRGLPDSIRKHPLFQRTFGADCNFEVTETANGDQLKSVFKTSKYVEGRYLYSFFLTDDNQLSAVEFDDLTNDTLELLLPEEEAWNLPKRLVEMHSHWVSREHKAVVFRNVSSHLDRSIRYFCRDINVVDSDAKAGEGGPWVCSEIPLQLQPKGLNFFLDAANAKDLDVVVRHDSRALFEAFEKPEFIHTLRSADRCSIRIDLPRYKLQFWVHNDTVHSRNFVGYRLDQSQPLANSLFGFQQYLALERDGTGPDVQDGRSRRLVLLPKGVVVADGSEAYRIHGDDSCQAQRAYYTYDVQERFSQLSASSCAARLELAALYAATSSSLPLPLVHKTGAEHATELVRQCWRNEPLSADERKHLDDVANWSSSSPTLSLVCEEVCQASSSLTFLHSEKLEYKPLAFSKVGDSYAGRATAYAWARKQHPHNARAALTVLETESLLGLAWKDSPKFFGWKRGKITALSAGASWNESYATYLSSEQELAALCKPGSNSSVPGASKTLCSDVGGETLSPLGKERQQDLEESERNYRAGQQFCLVESVTECLAKFKRLKDAVRRVCKETEKSLLNMVNECPNSSFVSTVQFRLYRASNQLPRAGVSDLPRFLSCDQPLEEFNQLLDADSVAFIQQGILVWLQLCVLETKLDRLVAHAESNAQGLLVDELQVRREWSVHKYPEWLVFEMEGGLQIRPKQVLVAQTLLENPNTIVQLNMGEGKTRVILPMLVLHLSRAQDRKLLRGHFLPQLLHEAKQHFERYVSASVMSRRIYKMPFHRNVELNPDRLKLMRAALEQCRRSGGLLMLSQEHSHSLKLKTTELQISQTNNNTANSNVCKVLQNLESLLSIPSFDMLDESDELLHHRYQLVYAMGSPRGLQARGSRWAATTAVLRQLFSSQTMLETLEQDGNAKITRSQMPETEDGKEEGHHLAAMKVLLTLKQPEEQAERVVADLCHSLAEGIVVSPPYELRWLGMRSAVEQKMLVKSMCESGQDVQKLLEGMEVKEDQLQDLLALRGILGCGVLRHCLEQRFRVNYGLKPGGAKRMAVPYRAADTPSERSEFSHPDCQLMLTALAFYYDGLDTEQIKETFQAIISLENQENKRQVFKQMFAQSSASMNAEVREGVDHSDKIDLTNAAQLQQLHKHFRFNTETINFFIEHRVLPFETAEFPQKIMATAWDQADVAHATCVGFSGTKDTSRLYPLSVTQSVPDDTELKGTDAEVAETLLGSKGVVCLDAYSDCKQASAAAPPPEWDAVLQACLHHKVHALIDCGGLMAGITNRRVAERMLCSLPDAFQGVTFYGEEQWRVLERSGDCEPMHISALLPKYTFAFYDERRCRGADLKLLPDAVGLVTVGPKMTWDKLAQATYRMRKLKEQQRVSFLVTADVKEKILAHAVQHQAKLQGRAEDISRGKEVTVNALLRWVWTNTESAIEEGIMGWALHGTLFRVKKASADPALCAVPDILHLADYGAAATQVSLPEIVRKQHSEFEAHMGEESKGRVQEDFGKIQAKVVSMGNHLLVQVNGFSHE
eukprot:717141-Rhodomonas_salina.1